jgi:hypothetical protein
MKKNAAEKILKKARAYRNARLHGGLSNLRILGKLVGCHEVHREMQLKKKNIEMFLQQRHKEKKN